ncbi:hypothetical protein Acy02nite_91300 [Actinoplanes cyaneus]|uniref:Uncharacterized protein n=1 Tax=Actinoplanes cyaneus TaxID=52696 RepID=A0A919ISC9_9ACTN|nr:hypothetical protein [Actinoplanes cyaneus]MCW2144488.1 hypothetical protein [Actinoplanes cyaneus]GID71249.1 hypothetical protein Acy02nite_91300 [Actinoplanes cyaneus]
MSGWQSSLEGNSGCLDLGRGLFGGGDQGIGHGQQHNGGWGGADDCGDGGGHTGGGDHGWSGPGGDPGRDSFDDCDPGQGSFDDCDPGQGGGAPMSHDHHMIPLCH